MSNIGPVGILIIVLVALILFGPQKLPELGRAFGRTLREFKEGTKELLKDDDQDSGEKGSRVAAAASKPRNEVEGEIVEASSNQDKRLPE